MKVTLNDIKKVYQESEVCMDELLNDIKADGLTIAEAFELYISSMVYAEEDEFYTIKDGEKIKLG